MADTNEVKCWTVIALNDSTGEVMTCVQNVAEPHEAIAITAREIKAKDGWDDVQIVCAVAGDCVTIMPCEDANKACYVADLGGEDPETCECGRPWNACKARDIDADEQGDEEAEHGDR